jgi:hypothetical protein
MSKNKRHVSTIPLPSPPLSPHPSPSLSSHPSPSSSHTKSLVDSLKKLKKDMLVFSTLNISGGKITNKKTEIMEFEKNSNILLLTEAHFDAKKANFKKKVFLSSFQNNDLGIIMLVDKNMEILEETIIVTGRAIFVKAQINKMIYNIFGIYGPSQSSDTIGIDFYRKIFDFMNNKPSLENIVFFWRLQRRYS